MTTRQQQAEKIADPADLSNFFFPTTRSASSHCYKYHVGPVRVDWCRRHPSKGRCLRADRAVAAGELLLVTPAVAAAPVDAVRREWRQQQQPQQKQESVAAAAERVLLAECQRRAVNDRGARRALNALDDGRGTTTATLPSMECLLGFDCAGGDDDKDDSVDSNPDAAAFDRDRLLQILRRNAFGGDFVTAAVAERRWGGSAGDDRHFRPPRLLGLYPLAALINHSCVLNAVRVFTVTSTTTTTTSTANDSSSNNDRAVVETMVVHACQRIAKDEEIVWSYIPLTQPFPIRRQRLREMGGFACGCERCQAEMAAAAGGDACSRSVEELEEWLSSKDDDDDKSGGRRLFSNATQRYLRVSFLPLYMDYLNQNATSSNRDRYPDLLKLCTQLHFSLAACHNASTEHLSILFLCYDLIGSLHTAEPTDSTHRQLVFWTDQLQRAVQCRYGALGNRVDKVRRMLQHGRTVTRNSNGMDLVEHKFI